MKRLSLAVVLALLLALCLVATAGPALAGTPKGSPTYTWHGGYAAELDQGTVLPDCPAVGNTTILHWRTSWWMHACLPWKAEEQSWYVLTDINMFLLDKPGPGYPDDPESLIPGWHFHFGNDIVCSVDPEPYWNEGRLPPKWSWLWTTKLTGFATPAGVHYMTDYYTGWNQFKGRTAYCTWTMGTGDATGKVWILH
jgi:hypothetical protein